MAQFPEEYSMALEEPGLPEDEVYVFPASYAQQRLWFLDQFEPGSPFYNIPAAVRLSGRLNVAALERTFQEIVRRHETLRTTFDTVEGQPVQIIALEAPFSLPLSDLSHLLPEEREEEALRLAVEEARRPFDLTRGPLLRVQLLRLAEQEHVILLTMHHIISDGWSIGVLVRELGTIYPMFAAGRSSPLPELPIQYADYASWQQEWLTGAVLEEQLDYWRQQLGGALPVLELPTDRPRPAVQSSRGATLSMNLSRELTDGLKALGQRAGATLFMTLLAGFQTLLYRYSGQPDICVGTPIANRNRAEIEGLIGFFVNTLVLRTNLAGAPTFWEVLRRVREVAIGGYGHQDLPFETLVEELQPQRDMSHTPLFQVMFILQNAAGGAQELPGLTLRQIETHSGTSTFDLTLSMSENRDGLNASLEYSTDLFDAATMRRMLDHFRTLLEGVVADPHQRIAEVGLLTAEERAQVVRLWNETAADYPRDLGIHQVFEQQAARAPEAVAVTYQGDSLTYGELNRRANQLAHYLQRMGVGPEMLVGISVERSLEMLVGVLGILKAGGAYVPVDPSYPAERIAYMLADAGVTLLVTQERLVSQLPPHAAQVVRLDANWPQIARESEANPEPHTAPGNLAYCIYTSGSMGRPKGVMLPHSNLVNAYYAWETGYQLGTQATSHLQMASLSFDVFTGDWVRALCSGGKLVLCPRDLLLQPERLYALMQQERVDCAEFVPVVLRSLAQHLDKTGERLDFVRLLICGSDAWYVGEYREFLRLCGPQTRLINSFGLTEATIDSCYYETRELEGQADRLVPIGRPFANNRLYILDERLQPQPVGIPGELYVGGAGVARGYFQRPDLTAERFVPDPFGEPGERLYRTGDLARFLADGNVEFLGRADDQVKIRGFRVELGEIEAVLGQHPTLKQAAVTVGEDRPGNPRLVAYLVSADGPTPTAGDLRRYLQERLPDYMVPSVYMFLEALPVTPNGKVDRKALPAPDWTQRDVENAYVAPRTETEERLAQVWAQVLGVERVGVRDNFFGLGGHSLLATQLISRVRDVFQVELPLRNAFESPTVAALAERVDVALRSTGTQEIPPIRRIPRDQEIPLSFAQQRLWFLDQLEPNSAMYNMPDAVRLSGALDVAALERSLNEIVRRHEGLRTNFQAREGRPVQVIAPERTIALPVIDLTELAEEEREAEVLRWAQGEAQQPFNLAADPLLRARLLRLNAEEHVILLTAHHIVSDDWSSKVLLQELVTLYRAFVTGQPSPLPGLAIQYADYAAWQREWLQGEVLEEQLGYWRKQLAGALPLLELPTDHPRPAMQTYHGAYQTFELPAAVGQAFVRLCQQEGVTPFMALLAAFQTFLSRYSGQDDIVIGTPIANRTRPESEPLIGFFVNTLVLRGDLSGNPSFRALLQRTRETALGAYAHQDVPFEMVVDAVQPQRDMSHSPLFQAMLVLQNTPGRVRELSGLKVQPVEAHSGTAKFDLTLFAMQEGERIGGAWEYNTDLFEAATVARMAGQFGQLLAGLVSEPDRAVGAVPLLTEVERAEMVVAWNDTAADYPADRCAHELFEQQVTRTPEAVAVGCEGETLTYAELNRRANQLAHYLRQRGVGPEVLVGLCVERTPEALVGILGVLKAGGAYLPLDPGYPPERLAYMLGDARVPVLLTQERLVERLPQFAGETLCLDADWPTIAQEADDNLPNGAGAGNLVYVIYTSGSTGRPKGVMITHGGLSNYLDWVRRAYPLEQGVGAPVHSSLAFDLTVTGLFGPLLVGGRVDLVSEAAGIEGLGEALRGARKPYSLVKITPAHLEVLAQQLGPDHAAERTRAFIIGGENLLGEALRFWQQHAPGTVLVNEYGPTETVVGCCVYQVADAVEREGPVSIGRAITNTQLYVLDTLYQPVPVGVAGELYIGGAGVARGYLGRPELTAERFVPDPLGGEPGSRLYKTGDAARYLADGNLEFLGRLDDQVKVRGFRIELGEIEAVLREQAKVRDVAVLAREDTPGQPRLVAYVVPEGDAPTIGELRERLGSKLPEYMVPGAYVFLEALPLTTNGKVDRKALPAPEVTRAELGSAYVAPRTPEEELLAGIWAQVLGLEQVGVHDSFFELGGDSILSIQVIAKANQAGLTLTPRQLFQHPTIAGLAAVAGKGPEVHADQGLVTGPVPLTPIQRWFLEQELPERHHWNQALLLEVRQRLQPELLRQAVEQLLAHHDALRLRFRQTKEQWEQVNARLEGAIPFQMVDLTTLPEQEQRVAIEQGAALLQAGLNLAEGPLMQVAYFDLGTDSPGRLLLVVHHLAMDGISWRVLLEDLQAAYEQLAQQEPVRLPPKTTSFQRWAQKLQEYAGSEALREELDYWLTVVRDSAGGLADLPGAENTEASTQSVSVSLSAEETRALLQEVPKAYDTEINDALLTALAVAFRKRTGVHTLLVDLEGHGREELFEDVDLSRTVGWFTSMFPVRLTVPSEDNPGETLRETKELLRRVPQHGVGYGLLRYLCPDADVRTRLQAGARAEIAFNYLGQMDQALGDSWLAPAGESRGPDRSVKATRSHLLEINGGVFAGRLHLEWTYSANLYRRSTIEAFADEFIRALRGLIAHCLSPEAGGYTDSDLYSLSPMQQGMLFHSLYGPESGVYVEQTACTLRGQLDVEAFARAWQRVVDRHPILRTAFFVEGLDEPKQAVRREVPVTLEQQDWRGLTSEEQESRLQACLRAEREQGFDLSEPPLFHLALMRTAEDSHLFVWSHHHILLDGWSVPILFGEVFGFYEAFRQGRDLRLPLRRPYRDYIAWLKRQDMRAAETFWRQKLAGFSTPTPLAMGRQDKASAEPSRQHATREIWLSGESSARLLEWARKQGLTVNTLVQGAWALLLSRYSGEDDVLFGATVSGRPADLPGVEEMIGLFINTLPIRVQVSPETRLVPWLRDLQSGQAEQRQYEYSSLIQIQEWSQVPRGLPMFESILVFESYPLDTVAREQSFSLSLKDLRSVEQTNYPFTVVAGVSRELMLRIAYDPARCTEADVTRMLGHLRTLLEGMGAAPEQRLGDLPLLTEAERQQILVGWNATDRDYPQDRCAHELFEAQVARTPEAVAVVFENQSLTYAELNRRANQLARYLRKRGVAPEALVGLCVDRSLEAVVGILGVLKAGGAYLPLDPDYPPERLAYMLADARVPVLLTQERLAERLPEYAGQVVRLDADWPRIVEEAEGDLENQTTSDNLAYVIYTSGSTGRPKGVQLTHRGLVNLVGVVTEQFEMTAESRVLQFASLSFDASVSEIFPPLLRGARLYLARRETLLSGADLLGLLQGEGITMVTLPPSLLAVLPAEELPDLRTLISAGEACPVDVARRWSAGRCFLNGYGPTETTVAASFYRVEEISEGATSIPIGKAIANGRLYVLDRQGRPVPVGAPGELYVGGVGVGRGYLGRPELTAERFVPDPFSGAPGARLYRTGDLVRYLPDANLEFLGRIDDQVKVRGFRIELGEIEEALREQTGIQAVTVVVREDAPGQKRLVAYIVPEPDGVPAVSELRALLGQRLPEYMVPSAYVFLEALPLTPNGKVDRKALPELDLTRAEGEQPLIAPRDEIEYQLVRIWEELLGVAPIGVTDSFFELGGHSLLAVRLMGRIEQKLGRSVPLVALFQGPTVEQLANYLRHQEFPDAVPSLVPLKPEGTHTPLFFIHPSGGSVHWYLELAALMDRQQPFYGLQAQGLQGDRPLQTHIEEMAAHYIQEMQGVQPKGPYMVGSWSFGVVVALEVAQQLQAQGERVSLLAMLDQGPDMPGEEPQDDVGWLQSIFGKQVPLPPVEELERMTKDEQLAFILEEMRRLRLMGEDVTLSQFRHLYYSIKTHNQAWRRYEPKPYPGRIVLFRTKHQPPESSQEADLGWGRLAKGGVQVENVRGDHMTMLRRPHVRSLAKRLKAHLDKAQAAE